ncbi:mechanosensitive ion channel protein [Candidatus Kaiserbacteria bacterium]|nr:MAG: mechanosensitive ion channel protein [Candidatus Kaiserbacteria bacterium]
MNELFTQALQFITSAHPYIQALLIIAASLFVALIILPFVAGVIKFATRKTKTDVDDKLIAALSTPILYLALLVGAVVALPLLGLPAGFTGVVQSFLNTFFVLVVAQGVLRSVRILLGAAVRTHHMKAINIQTEPLFNNTALAIIIAAALYGIFLIWGIDVTAWLASAGILGIAIGFAAKDTLSNIISGVFILADKPYSIGDFVVLGSGISGIVSNVGLRSTRIRTFDDEEVTIPNATIANDAITNKSTGPDTGRVKVKIGVAYGSDLAKVESMLLSIAEANERVLAEPAPSVSFLSFGDSALDFMLSCRVQNPLDVFSVRSELHHALNTCFAENNIEIPFPQQDVHLIKE